MKDGANITDQNEIRRLYAMGRTPEEISRMTKINVSVVEKFSPEYVEKVEQMKAINRQAARDAKQAEIDAHLATAEILKKVVDDAKAQTVKEAVGTDAPPPSKKKTAADLKKSKE